MTLQALEEQTLRPHEILVIDSSIGDGIAEVIRNHSPVSEAAIHRAPLAHEMSVIQGRSISGFRMRRAILLSAD